MGKMAKYFKQLGYEVRVITYKHHSEDLSAPVEIPAENSIEIEAATFEQVINDNYFNHTIPGKLFVRFKKAFTHRKLSFLLPNSSWSWYSEAVEKAEKITESWKPDLIYSSALPISSHFIARKVADGYKIAWVAEFRDLWSGGHGARVNSVSSFFLKKIEKWLLKPAMGLITVSDPLAAYLRLLHKKKVSVIYNGFDENPYAGKSYQKEKHDADLLTIVYTGSIYEGRDPDVLFEALRHLGNLRKKIQVKFYTFKSPELEQKIKNYNLEGCVKLMDFIPYSESLRIQSEADILLYLSYSSTTHHGRGILSGKVFEYLGAKRPILSIGADADHLLIQQGLMIHFNDAQKLKKQILSWIDEKEKNGFIKMSGDRALVKQYSRKHQTKKAIKFINSLLDNG